MRITKLAYGNTEQYLVEWRGQAGIGQCLENAIERCILNVRGQETAA